MHELDVDHLGPKISVHAVLTLDKNHKFKIRFVGGWVMDVQNISFFIFKPLIPIVNLCTINIDTCGSSQEAYKTFWSPSNMFLLAHKFNDGPLLQDVH